MYTQTYHTDNDSHVPIINCNCRLYHADESTFFVTVTVTAVCIDLAKY